MQKKDFLMALGKALFPGRTITYKSKPTALNLGGTANIKVKTAPDPYGGYLIKLVPDCCGYFEEFDVQVATEFLNKLVVPDVILQVCEDYGDLVIRVEDYPWKHLLPAEPEENEQCNCDCCEALRKANADKLRLQAELDEAKAELARLKNKSSHKTPRFEKFELPGGFGLGFGIMF